ncbi:hypothetical protein [Rhodanobacter sp. MP7CTX1]|uniref:hypothetical protein n=1 Tax=Rhodanobacter sp. MP7CTX1 TaxID=2723084 RepID=UPI001615E739|nr:hypothetical protein [Rhodanobacter sp. MP7CTX1]MBB6187684.1 hypothetical protein [Rhodanobacter sp. MP7CTX1]
MQIVRAFDSCFVAAHKMFSGKQQTAVNATTMMCFTALFYWVDVVALLNYTGVLSSLGWHGRTVVFIGGWCIAIALLFLFMPRASRILSDVSLGTSEYRIFRYGFFCSPAVIFFVLIFLQIRFPQVT